MRRISLGLVPANPKHPADDIHNSTTTANRAPTHRPQRRSPITGNTQENLQNCGQASEVRINQPPLQRRHGIDTLSPQPLPNHAQCLADGAPAGGQIKSWGRSTKYHEYHEERWTGGQG